MRETSLYGGFTKIEVSGLGFRDALGCSYNRDSSILGYIEGTPIWGSSHMFLTLMYTYVMHIYLNAIWSIPALTLLEHFFLEVFALAKGIRE